MIDREGGPASARHVRFALPAGRAEPTRRGKSGRSAALQGPRSLTWEGGWVDLLELERWRRRRRREVVLDAEQDFLFHLEHLERAG